MSRFILDTDTLSLYEHAHPAVIRNIFAHSSDDLAITVISVQEQFVGWLSLINRSTTRDRLARAYQRLSDTARFLAGLEILAFPEPAIARYEGLKTLKLKVGAMDLRIAAIVLEAGGTLVTRNLRDFRRVPHLTIADWSQ